MISHTTQRDRSPPPQDASQGAGSRLRSVPEEVPGVRGRAMAGWGRRQAPGRCEGGRLTAGAPSLTHGEPRSGARGRPRCAGPDRAGCHFRPAARSRQPLLCACAARGPLPPPPPPRRALPAAFALRLRPTQPNPPPLFWASPRPTSRQSVLCACALGGRRCWVCSWILLGVRVAGIRTGPRKVFASRGSETLAVIPQPRPGPISGGARVEFLQPAPARAREGLQAAVSWEEVGMVGVFPCRRLHPTTPTKEGRPNSPLPCPLRSRWTVHRHPEAPSPVLCTERSGDTGASN
jgi:hypothetical protein